ncbi:MAG: tonB family protein [Myxococcaceae bacterium]|nr:tonB family protein [Myxococcaceae bacterium]
MLREPLRSCALALAIVLGTTSIAGAQTPPPARTPAEPSGVPVMPPRQRGSSDVDYPAGASGDGVVVLVVLVDIDGSVGDAKPASGEEPFVSAAVAAAKTWKFDPATRDGAPVAARIKMEIVFHAPKPIEPEPLAPTPPVASGTSAGPAPPPPPAVKVDEVDVRGRRPAPGATSLGRAEVRQLPGAFGDPFRALDALPGVTPIVSGLPFFYVRGAPPGNVGYFLDGVRVPYLFHVGAGPSVIHPGLVEQVDLYPGGYPARFGRYAGGIVSAETTTPRTDTHGEGNVRLFDVGALVETGFADGKGTALVAGRYSYTAAILSLIAKDTTLDYRDYEARATYDVTPDDKLTMLTFGAYDLVGQTAAGINNVLFASEFYRLDLRWDHRFGPKTTARVALTGGFDQSRIPGQPRNSQDTLGAARVEVNHVASEKVMLRAGGDTTLDHLTADTRPYSDPDDPNTKRFNALFPARDDVNLGVWADVKLQLGPWEVVPGARLDVYTSGGATAIGVDPRIASRIHVAKPLHVIHTLGIAHQPPSFLIPIPGLAIGSLKGGLQTSIQSSAGVELDLPEQTTATVTVFDNVFLNMSDTLGVSQGGDAADQVFKDQRSQGSAVGAEVYIKRKLTRRFGGYVSYTLSRSTRSVGNEHFLSAFDRTHVANIAAAFDLGKLWRAGTRFTIYTGTPVVPPGGNGLIPPPRSLSPDRDPLFYRLDLRLEKRWNLTKTVWVSFVAEILNATLHTEVLQGQTIGPVTIPSLGLEGAF